MKMKAVNHKPVIRPEGTSALYGGEEVSWFTMLLKEREVEYTLERESLRLPVMYREEVVVLSCLFISYSVLGGS
jgi:hypothetical protein